jgi:signal transduction histidine kinase/uncharacterized protein YoaH (UPF0181 family)
MAATYTLREAHDALSSEQAALRRVATLVARGVAPAEVFAAVTDEIARLLGADFAGMSRYEDDDTQTVVAAWPPDRARLRNGTRLPASGSHNVAAMVRRAGHAVRIADWGEATGPVASEVRRLGVRSSIASPIVVAGQLWGLMIVDSRMPGAFADDTEERLEDFTELVATAVANSEARAQLSRLAEEQSALRRVATLVARGTCQEDVFAVVAAEVGRLLGAQIVHMVRYEPGDTAMRVAAWGEGHLPVGERWPLTGDNTAGLVRRTGARARINDYTHAAGPLAVAVRERGVRSSVGSPIVVDGRLWGAMVALTTSPEPQPEGTEARLAAFTELVATAVGNAQAHAEVHRLADEQAALRRVATLVANNASATRLLAAVAEEVGTVFGADPTHVLRYDPHGATVVASWGDPGMRLALGSELTLDGDGVAARVRATGRPARLDTYADAPGALAARLRELGVRSSAGAPIAVAGRLWGVVIAGTGRDEPLEPGTEWRIGEFTDLIATAIANAESRTELAASRARVVKAGDDARRRIERNLHDGAQQRLVSLGLWLRAVQSRAPEELAELLEAGAADLKGAIEDLQEISRGIHPAVLSERGLEPALRTLARRAAVPVELDVRVERRLPEEVEVAAYYVASEALTNAVKHASASVVEISLSEEDALLRLSVRDDGTGGAEPGGGSGLIGLSDRLDALGGTIEVASPPGAGTAVLASIPV